MKLCDCIIEYLKTQTATQVKNYFIYGPSYVPQYNTKGIPDCPRCQSLRRIFDTEEEVKFYRMLFR